MQFKHPEILYALFALLIPIFIHLFQLQRYIKTEFTNVAFLKKIHLQTRKSARLKKFLVLLARMFVFAALIIAFAQPYFSKNDTSKIWSTNIYLDNSLSMQAKGERGELLKRAVQDLIEHVPNSGNYSLFTNDNTQTDLSKESLIKQLKAIQYSPKQASLNTILLQSQQVLDKNKERYHKQLFISDFQNHEKANAIISTIQKGNIGFDFIQLHAKKKANISIDSIYISKKNLDSKTISLSIRNDGESIDNLIINAYQQQVILAKTSVSIANKSTKEVQLRLGNEVSNIRLSFDYDDRFIFDNTYYISFQKNKNPKVLLLGDLNSFLAKIFTSDEFETLQKRTSQFGYEIIDRQDLVVVNAVKELSISLQEKLTAFVNKGGNLLIIPSKKSRINDLNPFFNRLGIGQITAKRKDTLQVTKIHFSHPILDNVFEKKVNNFQYPRVTTCFETVLRNEHPILSFEDQKSFFTQINRQKGKVFWVSAALDKSSSDFIKTPLIVPICYNIGKQSLKQTQLSYRVGRKNEISIPASIQKDAVLNITGTTSSFIPLQEIHSESVLLHTEKEPHKAGFYTVKIKDKILKNLAFNAPKKESNTDFITMNALLKNNSNIHGYDSIQKALTALENEQKSTSYFKWFILLSLLFLLIEILLLKYF